MSSLPLRTMSIALSVLALCATLPPRALAQARLVINDVTVPIEANSGVGNAAFTVSFADNTSHGNVTVFYSTTGGTATAGSQCSGTNADYVGANNFALTFNSTENSKQINITVCGDTRDEPDETFFVNLSSASGGAVIQDAQGQATLIDDDNPPSLRINDVTVGEGNTGTTNAQFTVSVTGSSGNPITVSYATANRSATAGSCGTSGVDYATTSAPLSLTAGQPSQTLSIPVCGDGVREGNEQFEVRLSNASNATIQDGTGVATITDDEPLPTLSITPTVEVSEPSISFQSVHAVFTVTRGGSPTTQTVSVQYSTGPGTASAGSVCRFSFRGAVAGDYITQTGTLTFSPGGGSTQEIRVPICYDFTSGEPAETFNIKITNAVNATLTQATGTATIH
jgi:hypothetical protein